MTAGCELHDDPERSKNRGNEQSRLSAPSVGDWGGCKGANETSSLQGGYYVGRKICCAHFALVFQSEVAAAVVNILTMKDMDVSMGRSQTDRLNSGMVRTPPMIPESIPKSMPPKHA